MKTELGKQQLNKLLAGLQTINKDQRNTFAKLEVFEKNPTEENLRFALDKDTTTNSIV